ncbi:MAG: hypothetical protein KDM91_10560 [Verrucomicrobiae bacterium]|nr:hypothetical protein [Verrucomicrobiae bacterium]
MSDNQKVIVSLLGAVVGHLLLLVLVGAFLFLTAMLAPQRTLAASVPEPEEVTVLLSDLLEQAELVPKELTQRYMRTDPDQEADRKPEDAAFHSDRNTLATSELAPDPAADKPLPTIRGEDRLPIFDLRDRNFVDGDFKDASAASAPSAPSPAAPQTPSLETAPLVLPPVKPVRPLQTEAKPADEPREAPDANPDRPAEADSPPERAAERSAQPEAETLSRPEMAESRESFTDPFAAAPLVLSDDSGEVDRDAAKEKPADLVGPPADPEMARPASSPPLTLPEVTPPPTPMSQSAPASADIPPSPKPPSETPAFTPETRAHTMTGTISNRGKSAALDVEESTLGKYKKAVTQAVERQWHRYRESNGSFVTYGSLKVKFRVTRDGKVRNLKLVKSDSNTVMTEFTLRAVMDADIPAMSDDVARILGDTGLEITYEMIVY